MIACGRCAYRPSEIPCELAHRSPFRVIQTLRSACRSSYAGDAVAIPTSTCVGDRRRDGWSFRQASAEVEPGRGRVASVFRVDVIRNRGEGEICPGPGHSDQPFGIGAGVARTCSIAGRLEQAAGIRHGVAIVRVVAVQEQSLLSDRGALEMTAAEMAIGLHVIDHRLDGRAAPELFRSRPSR
jgi:hypothetical protein